MQKCVLGENGALPGALTKSVPRGLQPHDDHSPFPWPRPPPPRSTPVEGVGGAAAPAAGGGLRVQSIGWEGSPVSNPPPGDQGDFAIVCPGAARRTGGTPGPRAPAGAAPCPAPSPAPAAAPRSEKPPRGGVARGRTVREAGAKHNLMKRHSNKKPHHTDLLPDRGCDFLPNKRTGGLYCWGVIRV